jgi:hypothetical protein
MHVQGEAPWFPNLTHVMDPAPDLLDRLVTEWDAIGGDLEQDGAFWLGCHLWMADKLAGEALSGKEAVPLRQGVWAIYMSGYWCNVELQRVYGIPDALINFGMEATVPTEDSLADMVAKLRLRQEMLSKGGDALLDYLQELLREEPCTGALHGDAYNAGVMAIWSGTGPLGERPSHLEVQMGGPVRTNPRDFLNIDYPIPTPSWLDEWRARFEVAVRQRSTEFEAIISGEGSRTDLRDMWRQALAWGSNNWGDNVNSLDRWSQEYFNAQLFWGTVFNFGLEGVSLAALVALLERDEEAARRAVSANALQLGAWGPAVMALIDPSGSVPVLVP